MGFSRVNHNLSLSHNGVFGKSSYHAKNVPYLLQTTALAWNGILTGLTCRDCSLWLVLCRTCTVASFRQKLQCAMGIWRYALYTYSYISQVITSCLDIYKRETPILPLVYTSLTILGFIIVFG